MEEKNINPQRPTLLAVGRACIDVINDVESYPEEDADVRAFSSQKRRGGNATNALVIAAQLGVFGSWLGLISDDENGRFVLRELESYGIKCIRANTSENIHMPTSYITRSRTSGSRTIVHYSDMPEITASQFERCCCQDASRGQHLRWDWIHFEGRGFVEVQRMLNLVHSFNEANHPGLNGFIEPAERDGISFFNAEGPLSFPCPSKRKYINTSVEIEKPRHAWKDVKSAEGCTGRQYLVCAWGSNGAWAMERRPWLRNGGGATCATTDSQDALCGGTRKPHPQPIHCSTLDLEHEGLPVVDSVGAGDAFVGATLAAFLQSKSLPDAVSYGCRVASLKCTQEGFNMDARKAELEALGNSSPEPLLTRFD